MNMPAEGRRRQAKQREECYAHKYNFQASVSMCGEWEDFHKELNTGCVFKEPGCSSGWEVRKALWDCVGAYKYLLAPCGFSSPHSQISALPW